MHLQLDTPPPVPVPVPAPLTVKSVPPVSVGCICWLYSRTNNVAIGVARYNCAITSRGKFTVNGVEVVVYFCTPCRPDLPTCGLVKLRFVVKVSAI